MCVCVLGVRGRVASAKALLRPFLVGQDAPDGPEEVHTDQDRLEPRSDDEDT